MRKLLIFVIGFVLGCAGGIWILDGIWMIFAALGSFTLLFCLRYIKRDYKWVRVTSVVLIGLAVGLVWIFSFDNFYIRSARETGGTSYKTTIEALDYSYDNSRGTCGKGKVKIDGKTYKVYYYLADFQNIRPGDKISGRFSFAFTDFNNENEHSNYQGSGIFLIAQAKDEKIEIKHFKQVPWKYFPVKLRKNITDKIDEIFPEDTAGFSRALLLGDTSKLDPADDAALKISGIRHVVAVSGLHISILMSFIFIFIRSRRFINSIISIPLLLLFTAIAGFTPSVIRACVMQIIFVFSMDLEKEYDAPTSLAMAVLLLVFINPLVITSIGFQLSVSCVIGILLFSRRIHDYLLKTKLGPAKGKSLRSKIIRAGVGSVSVTLSTMVMTLPISAYYFGSVSLVSVLSNFLLLGLISWCFYGVAISCAVGFLVPAVGHLLAGVFSFLIRLVLLVSKWLSKVPFAAVSTNNLYVILWIVFVYVLFAVFLLSKKKKPILLAVFAIGGLCASLTCACVEAGMDQYRVTVLDVGQGQCILIESKDDCYVVDCGGFSDYATADLAAQALRTRGVFQIDGLILTHFDYDHAASAEALLYQIKTDYIYVPDADDENAIREKLEYSHSGSMIKVRKTTALDCGIGEITIYPGEPGEDGNESSLCVLFQAKKCDILITGDRNTAGERYLIDTGNLPLIDILIVGHHGADSSTSLYLLQNLQPQTAVISVGKDNQYGHPDPDVINRLKRFNCTIWRTDRDGTIVFRG